MKIAITGASGFLGQSLVRLLTSQGHALRCWKRINSDLSMLKDFDVEWLDGELGDQTAANVLLEGCDALVHAAIWRPGAGFRGAEGNIVKFAEKNVIGSLQLFQAAVEADLQRVIYVSSCSVHEEILPDRTLDEFHPLIAHSHYGAHKAAVEAFVHAFARASELNITAIRPTGIYGAREPICNSKWYDLISQIARGEPVECKSGGKEVHVDDVAKAICILLDRQDLSGQVFACYDRYISEMEVAEIAKQLTGSKSVLRGEKTTPKNQIDTQRIRALGMEFGGTNLLHSTVQQIVHSTAPIH